MDGALRAGVSALERAIAYALGSLALVTPVRLAEPTPCDRWDLHELLLHLGDSMAALQEAAESGVVAIDPAGEPAAVIPLVRDRAVRLLGAWTNGPASGSVLVEDAAVSAPLVAGAGAIELTVHGWDVARACGGDRPIPADLADELFDLAVLMVRPGDRAGRFARPIAVPGDAPPDAKLLGFLGRTA